MSSSVLAPDAEAPAPEAEVGLGAAELRDFMEREPRWLARYKGWQVLGTGSFAVVVQTHSKDLGRDVAVKIFLHPMDRQRFQTEIQNARLLESSPYTVRMYSPFWGYPAWIEMELVEGPSLGQELERRSAAAEPWPLTEALDTAVALTSALADAHRQNVVHRDIKPANILLPASRSPLVKLIDFGVSRVEGRSRTITGPFNGTPEYAAPEAFLGRKPQCAADVYSLGLCLYRMFTGGAFPWQVREDASVLFYMGCHVNVPPSPARTHAPHLDADLDYLLRRCLGKEPERRPSAHQVREALAVVRRRTPPPSQSWRAP
jgi:serine/threonine-protein kinase